MKKCKICNADYKPFHSFGSMPLGNGFLSPQDYAHEYFYNLDIGFCSCCSMVQLYEQPAREMMFHENYAYFSSVSGSMITHFQELYNFARNRYLKSSDPFVVEIGSNDGILLKNFAAAGIRHLGLEPSENVAKAAAARGINTITDFFSKELAEKIIRDYGQADLFMGANVMCHIPYLHSVAEGIKLLLKPEGVLIFEDPYLGAIIEKTSYDQIYDEHVFYFSVHSVQALFKKYDMEIIDIVPLDVHGGSMRYILGHSGKQPVREAVVKQLEYEKEIKLDQAETYSLFSQKVEKSREKLVKTIREIKARGKRITGYGATSKSTTVINYCGLTPDLIEFISDTTPGKQGKFSPGLHIPVKPYEEFQKAYPDYALLFAWNYGSEIIKRESAFKAGNGKWIVYVPEVAVIE